jgi:hypothetical protein
VREEAGRTPNLIFHHGQVVVGAAGNGVHDKSGATLRREEVRPGQVGEEGRGDRPVREG